MGIGVVTNESTLALKVESVEGTYVAPAGAGDYIEVVEGALELNKTRELLERNLLSSTVEAESARVGLSEVTGNIGVELKANDTEGDAPQSLDVLLRSLLGGKRQITADQTSSTGHTSTVINFADTSAFSVNDLVLVKEAGAYEVRPISAVTTDTSITLAFALTNGAPSDEVVVAQVTTYYHDTANAVTFSAEHNMGSNAIKQKAAGLRAASGAVENWVAGQIPTMSFAIQGLSLEREDANALYTGTYADALPPVALSACAWIDGNKMSYTELGLSIENEIATIQDACAASGKIGSRIVGQTTTVNINPYLDDTDLTMDWDIFNNNTDVSFFAYAYNPSNTAGEFDNVVAMWIPQGKIIESPVADIEGIVANNLVIQSHRDAGNDTIFMSFI